MVATNEGTSLVGRFAAKHCPEMVQILSKSELVEFVQWKNTSNAGACDMLFLRSKHPNWTSHPQWGELVDAATDAGRERLALMAASPTYRPVSQLDRWIFGPATATSKIMRNRARAGDLAARIAALGINNTPIYNQGNNSNGDIVAKHLASPLHTHVLKSLALLGYRDVQSPTRVFAAHVVMNARVSLKYTAILSDQQYRPGFKAIPVHVEWSYVAYYYVPDDGDPDVPMWTYRWPAPANKAWDQTPVECVADLDLRYSPVPSKYWAFDSANPVATSKSIASAQGSFNLNNSERARKGGILNDAYGEALTVPITFVPGALNALNHALDDYYLPLITPPDDHELVMVGTYSALTRTTVSVERAGDATLGTSTREVARIDTVVSGADMLGGAVPMEWYFKYIETGYGLKKPKSATDAAKVREGMAEFAGMTVTFTSYADAFMLPENIVEQLTIYQDYAKAREKNCQDNDFMSKEYQDGITWGTAQTTVNGQRSTSVLYGYRDGPTGSSVPEGAIIDFSTYRISYTTPFTASGRVTVKDGEVFVTEIGAADFADLLAYFQGGASFTNGSLQGVMAAWSISTADVETTTAGMADMSARINGANDPNVIGTGMAVYSNAWEGLGVTGYPDYYAVGSQDGFKLAIRSKVLLAKHFSALRTMFLGYAKAGVIETIIPAR